MKIALVSFYCLESSIPLARYLSAHEQEVDLYALMVDGNQNGYVVDFSKNKQPNGFINEKILNNQMNKQLKNYISTFKLKFFIYPIRWIPRLLFLDLLYAFKLAKFINCNNYDKVHVIHATKRFWVFLFMFLNKNNFVQTLHEVTAHDKKKDTNNLVLHLLVKYSIPTIFHSDISKERFITYRNKYTKKYQKANLTMIRFGLFETYKLMEGISKKEHPKDKFCIINFGRIIPYKGIHILIEAVKLVQNKYPVHLIVAGSGTPYFNFQDIESFEFINRPITNDEIIELIKMCDLVVLPYTSASQSGIPMTVFPFGKPIIASNIAGFKETIDHQSTGILVDDISSESFAIAIENYILNINLREKIKDNIDQKYNEEEFSWQNIAKSTLTFYQKNENI